MSKRKVRPARPGRSWAKYLETAYRRTLENERELLLFIDEIAKAVDLHGDSVTFGRVLENVKGLRSAYGNQCDRLRQACERHKLGLGGEHVDALLIKAVDTEKGHLDWLQSKLAAGQCISMDREELVPDEGGESFMGVSLHIGPSGEFQRFVGGAIDLREAIADAREKGRKA